MISKQAPSLNIIGAGRVGQTLARLFHLNHCFRIKGIHNRSASSARQAVEFIGQGEVCTNLADMPAADVIMISTPDSSISETARALVGAANLAGCKLVFHCSGVTGSAALSGLRRYVSGVASIHPNMTFASASVSVDHFAGTFCAYEGDANCYELLGSIFEKIGGHVFEISAENKAIYHAATVLACNDLVALLDVAVQLYKKIGVGRETALAIMQPIVKKTVNNVFQLDTVAALTGPIARGDAQTVQLHLDALEDPYIKDLYKSLGLRLVDLASQKGNASKKQLDAIQKMLGS